MERINCDKKSSKVVGASIKNDGPRCISMTGQVLTSLTAGAIAGAIAKSVIAPLDRTKIYFQSHPDKRYRFKGALRFLNKTYRETGFLSLWRGNSATMARIIPYASIQFMSHEQYKKLLGVDSTNKVQTPAWYRALAGSMAGLTGQALTYPLDRARAVMAVTKVGEFRNIWDVFSRNMKLEGVTSLYKGFAPTMLGVVPYAGTSFFTYGTLKAAYIERNISANLSNPEPTHMQRMLFGAIAGICGQIASYPLDIVRRRMQTARQMGIDPSNYSSIHQTILSVLRREGLIRGLYKGLSMNFIKGPISTGISFTVFDFIFPLLKKAWINNF